jgi:hypothetical protein
MLGGKQNILKENDMKYVAPINLPNLTVSDAVKKTLKDTGKTLTGSTQIVTNVVVKLAIKNPTWRFEVVGTRYATDKELASDEFIVYEGRESLGRIELGFYQNKDAVVVRNDRTTQDMERYRGRTTTKEAVALKHVEKYFYARTTEENIESNFTKAYDVVDSLERSTRSKSNEAFHAIGDKMHHFIMSRWDDFVIEENVNNKGREYPSLKREWEKIKALDASKSTATIIMLVGKEYVMRKDGVLTKGTELSDEIRTKVGMLKLLDDESFNPNLGVKVNSSLFVLI